MGRADGECSLVSFGAMSDVDELNQKGPLQALLVFL